MKIDRRLFVGSLVATSVTGTSVSTATEPLSQRLACRIWADSVDLDLTARFKPTAAIECQKGICLAFAPIGFGALGFLTSVATSGGKTVAPPFDLSSARSPPDFFRTPTIFWNCTPGCSKACLLNGTLATSVRR
jgi:hypothetical protein